MNRSDTSQKITITEAARRLNVSERTVYRMMKSGKVNRIYEYDSVRLMSDEIEKIASIRSEKQPDTVSHIPSPMDTGVNHQLAAKDAQIAQLLAQQQQMSQMLNRLQEQLHELTRFVLSQTPSPPARGFEWAFWRRKKREGGTKTDLPAPFTGQKPADEDKKESI